MPAMRAAILEDRNRPLVIDQVTLDAPRTGEILVRIARKRRSWVPATGRYKSGRLRLDEMVTRTYRLEEVNQAFEDLKQGVNLRGVLVF